AAIKFRARYAINDKTAILGEVEYGKLIGDAADSPIVQDDYQPALRLGIVRKFSFGF
ncbi:MAG TPA: MipA/OmpV family protein, partial [Paracoccus sp.]|nr:MipA/OmpV family protein [Paracoccus sp. (in: a-proteobacteria)]